MYCSPVRWSTRTEWRWLKVPRRVSCPDSRMVRPSVSSDPRARASPSAQSTALRSSAPARCSSHLTSLGWTLKPSGTVCQLDQQLVEGGPVDGRVDGRVGGHRGRPLQLDLGDLAVLLVVGVVEGLLEALAELLQRPLGVLERQVAPVDQGLGVELAHRAAVLDPLVHQRLGERRLVGLVVAVAPVAPHVDDDVLLERLAELEGQPGHADARLGVVAVHVEDGRLDHLGHVGGVGGGAAVVGAGGEPDLVVDHDVDGAAGAVAAQLGQVEGLGDHALAGEGGVAVDQDGQDRRLLAPVEQVLAWPGRCPRPPG